MGYFSWEKYRTKMVVKAFALLRLFINGWSFTRNMGMPMFSRLFALINDQSNFGLVFRLSTMWLLRVFIRFCLLSKFLKFLPVTV